MGGLDILSDTQGVDFGPYLQHVLQTVRENWYHLIPESQHMKKGKLAIEFAITKDGKVADMGVLASSGDPALDRPAWGSITASTPFPPLPSEFTGPLLALRFRFVYNPDDSDLQDSAPAAAAPSGTDHRVWIDVVVTDKSGNAVPGLEEQDFILLDDKQPRKIVSFQAMEGTSRAIDPTLQVIFVIDAVNEDAQTLRYGRTQLSKFLRQDDGPLSAPTSLVILTDKSTQVQPTPTRDGKALADSLNSNQLGFRTLGRSTGVYGAEDRRTLSLQALDGVARYEATQPGRKVIIWLSPGWAMLSGPNAIVTEKNEQGLFRSIVTLSQELREARITLYSVDPLGMNDAGGFQKFYYESFLKGVPSYREAQNGNLAL